jgi:hypothetical protein
MCIIGQPTPYSHLIVVFEMATMQGWFQGGNHCSWKDTWGEQTVFPLRLKVASSLTWYTPCGTVLMWYVHRCIQFWRSGLQWPADAENGHCFFQQVLVTVECEGSLVAWDFRLTAGKVWVIIHMLCSQCWMDCPEAIWWVSEIIIYLCWCVLFLQDSGCQLL